MNANQIEGTTDLAHAFYFLSLWLWIKLFSWIGEIFSLHLCQFFFFWPMSVSCQKWKKCQKVPRLLCFQVPNHPCFLFFQSPCNFLSCFCTLWNGENNNCLPLEAVVPKNNVENGFRSTECQENLLLVLFFLFLGIDSILRFKRIIKGLYWSTVLEFLFNWRECGIVIGQGTMKYAVQITSQTQS